MLPWRDTVSVSKDGSWLRKHPQRRDRGGPAGVRGPSVYDESGGETFREVMPDEKNELVSIPIRENEIYGKELQIMIMAYLGYIEEEPEQEIYDEILYEGIYYLDEVVVPNNENNNG